MNAGRMIFGIVLGAAAGAVLGVLYAPDKGTETRRKLLEKSDDYTQNLKNQFNNLKNKWGNKSNNEFAPENEFRQENVSSPSI